MKKNVLTLPWDISQTINKYKTRGKKYTTLTYDLWDSSYDFKQSAKTVKEFCATYHGYYEVILVYRNNLKSYWTPVARNLIPKTIWRLKIDNQDVKYFETYFEKHLMNDKTNFVKCNEHEKQPEVNFKTTKAHK